MAKPIHYGSYVHIYSLHKDKTKGEAELRGTNPKRLDYYTALDLFCI